MRTIGLLAAAFLLAVAGPALADSQDIANEISREMLSPYCPGVTLHDCPSGNAQELRRRIIGWADDGMDKQAIRQRLQDEFGPQIWASPATSGSGLWAWVLPIVAVVAGIGLVAVLATRWSRKTKDDEPQVSEISPDGRRRLDVELAALRDQQG